MESFQDIFNSNWDIIVISIVASMCFHVISYGRTSFEKAIFATLLALILVSVLSSFQWASQKDNSWILISLLVLFWIILTNLIVLLIPFFVKFTGLI